MDWKKEIKLGDLARRKAKEPSEEDVVAETGPTSIWKKEISFGKRPQTPEAPAAHVVPTAPPHGHLTPWAADEPAAAGRGPDPAAPVDVPPAFEAAPPVPPAAPGAPGPTPPPAAEHPWLAELADAGAVGDAAWHRATEAVPRPDAGLGGAGSGFEPFAAAEVAPPMPAPEHPPAGFEIAAPVEPPPSTHEPAAFAHAPEPVPPLPVDVPATIAATPAPAGPAPPFAPAPPTMPAEPLAPVGVPVTVPAAAPGIHPPVPAAELPPLGEPEEPKKPLLKRELSFRRKPRASQDAGDRKSPKQKERKARRRPKDAPAPAPAAPPAAAASPSAAKQKQPSRQKRLVGLKVGGSQLAAARVLNNGHAELVQLAREDLPEGIVVGGELRDPDALAHALKEFFRKHKLPKRGVRLGIANNRIGVRTFEITGITDPKQLTNAIKFRAQEALPIPIEDAVLDYHVLGEGEDEQGEPVRRILLVVAYRELIDRYVSACKKAGITLAGIDLEAFALLRALAAPAESAAADAALVAVAIGHERSTFAVSDGRTCEFTRVLEWGGAALNVAIARELDSTPGEVEHIKRSISLLDDRLPEGVAPEVAHVAREAVRRQIQSFARELVSSLQFYQNQPGSLGIGEIVVTGGTTHLPGLSDELQRLIGVRVAIADPLVRVRVGKKVDKPAQIGSLAVAIGLGIDD